MDGVDVRLLVPGSTDIPVLRPLSRAGYRPLLEAGVRVFEWNGSMLHAKTAVADGKWARVGSTNLNHRQLDGQPRARRDRRRRGVREADGRDVSRRSRQRDGSRAGCAQPRARAGRTASPGSGGDERRRQRRPGGCRSDANRQHRLGRCDQSARARADRRRTSRLVAGAALAALALSPFTYPRGFAYPVATSPSGWRPRC